MTLAAVAPPCLPMTAPASRPMTTRRRMGHGRLAARASTWLLRHTHTSGLGVVAGRRPCGDVRPLPTVVGVQERRVEQGGGKVAFCTRCTTCCTRSRIVLLQIRVTAVVCVALYGGACVAAAVLVMLAASLVASDA